MSNIKLEVFFEKEIKSYEFFFNVRINAKMAKLIAYGKMFEQFMTPGNRRYKIYLNQKLIEENTHPSVVWADIEGCSPTK